jgi:DNA-binding transcriptional MerR regulator
MLDGVFSVGRFARLAGGSAKLLRAYDQLGIFRPAWVDPASSYRYYSPAQLPGFRRILALRDMGMGLAEIAELVRGGDLSGALERRRAELERDRREIERRLRTLEITVDAAPRDGGPFDVVVRPLAAEAVATMAVGDDEDDGAAFYALETHVRDLHRRAHRPPGALIPAEAAAAVEIFVPVTGSVEPVGRIGFRRLPAVRAATVLVGGGYGALPDARLALERWVSAAGMAATGPLRIRYLQFGAERELAVPPAYVVDRPDDYLTELQLPVG